MEGNDVDDTLKAVDSLGNSKEGKLRVGEGGITLGDHDDWVALACCDLVDGVLDLRGAVVARGHHDDGHKLIDEGEGTVLELASEDALRVHVGDLLDLECGLEDGGGLVASAKEE